MVCCFANRKFNITDPEKMTLETILNKIDEKYKNDLLVLFNIIEEYF